MRKKLRNMNQVKKYRLYKAKSQWVIATMAFVSLGLGAFTTSAQAEDAESTDSAIGGTTAQGQTLQSQTTTLRTSASATHAVASPASMGTQQERATASSASGKQTQTQLSATKPQQIQEKSALQSSATSPQTKQSSVGNTTRTAVKDTATASNGKGSFVTDPSKVSQASADVKDPASIDATNIKYNTTTNTAMVNDSISATELQRLKTALASVTDNTGVAATINQVADVPDVNAYKVQINGKDSDTLNVDQLKSTDVQQITVSGNFNPNDSLILDVPMGYGITKITGDNSSNFTGGSTVGTNDYYYTYTAKNKVQGNLNFYFSMDIPSYVNGNGDKLNISKLVDGNQTDSLPISVSLNGIRLKQPTITLNKTAIIKGLHYTNENNLNNTGLYNTQGGQLVKSSSDYFHSVIPSTDNRYYPTFNASDTLSADYQYTINFDGNTTLTVLPTVHDGVTYLINNADAANYKLGQDPVNTIEVTVKKGTYDLNNYLFTNGLSEGLSAAGINKLKAATDGTINVKKTITPSNSLEVNGTAVAINPDNATQVVSTPFNVAKYNYYETTNGYEFLPTAEQINQAPNGALVDQAYLVNANSLDLPADGLDYIFEASNKGDSNTVYTGLVITNVSGDSPSKLKIVRSDGTSQDVSATSYAANNNASWYQFDEPVKVGDKIVITGINTHNPTLGNSINVVYAKLYGKLSSNPAPDTVAKFVTDFDYQVRSSTGDVVFQSTTPHEDVIYTGSENYFQSDKHGIGSDAIIKQLDQGITLDTNTSTLNNVVPAGQDINTGDYGSIGRGTNDYFTITNGTEDSIAKHITAQPLTGYLAVSNNVSVNTSALTRLLGVSANNIHVYRDTNDPNLNIIKIDNVRPDAIPRLSSMIVTNPGNTGMAVNVLDQVNNYVSTGSVYTVSPTALPNTTLSIPKSIYLTTNKAAIGATDSSYFDQNMLANATFLTSKVAAPTVYSQEASIKGSGDSSATDTGFVDTAKSRTATVTQVLYNGGNTPINTVAANIDLSDANAGILLGGAPTITNIADNSSVPADVTYQDIKGNNTTDATKAVKATITIGTTATNATATLLHGAGYQIQYQLTIPTDAQLNNTQKYAIKLSTTDLDSANTPLTDNLHLRVSQTATQTIRVKEMLADTLPADVKSMTAQITGIAGDSITPDYSTLTQAINNLGNYNILGLFDSQGNKVTAVTLAATNPDLYVEVQNKAVKQITTNVDIPSNKGPQNVPNVTGITGQTVDVTVPNLPGYTKDKTTVPATVNPDGTITVDTPNKVTGDKGYVTYTPDAQKINVKFVDQTGTQLGQVITLTGVSDGEVNLDPAIKAEQALINTGYTPSKGDNNGLDSITKTFTNYGKVPTYIVELSNIRSVEVDKVPKDNVPFANVYTVDYVTPNGQVVGTTTLVGNPGDKHDLTPDLPKGYVPVPGESGNITINKGQDPKTPIIFNVTTPAGQDSDGIQTWTKAQVPDSAPYANQYTINFITPGGKVVGTTTLVGNPGDKHDLTPDLPKGYVPVPGESGNITIDKGQDPKTPIIFNVTTPAGQDSDGIQTWTKAQVPDSAPYANQYTVNFITPGGKVVGTTTLVGNPGDKHDLTPDLPKGYVPVPGESGNITIDKGQDPKTPIIFNVTTPAGQDSDGIQTWTKAQVPDSSSYANQYTVNFITPGGKVVGTTTVVGNPGNLIIVTGNVPNGYTLAGGDGRVEIPNNQAPSQPINVTIIPNSPSGASSSTTPNTTTTTANSAGNPTGTSTVKPITNVNRNSYNNVVAKGSALQKNTAVTGDHNHTWSMPTGSDKSNNNAQTKFTSQSSHVQAGLVHSNGLKPDTEKSRITALPQTNEQETSVWAMLGFGLLSLLGLFGFTKQRKREDDH